MKCAPDCADPCQAPFQRRPEGLGVLPGGRPADVFLCPPGRGLDQPQERLERCHEGPGKRPFVTWFAPGMVTNAISL